MQQTQQQRVALEVAQYWRAILVTLRQRGLLRERSRQGGYIYPEATAIILPDRVIFVLDMHHLGGISREDWFKRPLWRQWRAALHGRRAFVSDGGGLAITVARRPDAPRKRLPTRLPLGSEWLNDRAYHVSLGVDVKRRQPLLLDLAEEQRAMLVGGTTGGGKTNLLLSIVLQLTAKHPAGELQLAIVDTKEVDFSGPFAHLPQLFLPVAHTLDEAAELIERVEGERVRRQALMAGVGVRDWRLYNARLREGEPLPLLLLMIDEAADFAGTGAMETLVQVARKGRSFGISVVVATQHPTVKVISPQVKANLPYAIAFQTKSGSESRVILDRNGAEHLRRPGRCLTFLDGRWREVQTLLVEEDVVAELAGRIEKPQPALSELEVDLVRYAMEQLDGAFIINRLYDAFKGQISRRQLLKLGQAWERRGWLTSPEDAASPRLVTHELVGLCDSPPAPGGVTRSHGTTGTTRYQAGARGTTTGTTAKSGSMKTRED